MANKRKLEYPDWFLSELSDSKEKENLLLGKYKGSDKLHFLCSECSTIYTQSIANHITKDNNRKQGCPVCAKKKRSEAHKLTSSKKRIIYPEWFIRELWYDEDKEKAILGILSTHTKVIFKCACGKPYEQQITNHIKLSTGERKSGSCSECSKNKISKSYREAIGTNKPYPEWFINELNNEEDKDKARTGELKSDDKVEFYCPVCKEIYTQRVASHIKLSTHERKKGCPKCGKEKQKESSRKTRGIIKPYPDWFIEDLYLNEDKEEAKYFNFLSNEVKQFYCKEHNVVYTQTVGQHIDIITHERKYNGCSQCSKNKCKETLAEKREYPEWFINELVHECDKEKAKNGTLLASDKVEFFCNIHKKSYFQLVSSHIDTYTKERKHGCSLCGRDKSLQLLSERRVYPEWFINDLVNEQDKKSAQCGVLTSTAYVEFICPYNHIYLQQVKNHIILSRQERYKGCPICFPNRSKVEKEIEEFIISLGLETTHTKFKNENKQWFEVDIYIPDKMIGIEYNGSYYHSTLPISDHSKNKLYHLNKYIACRALGIRLVSIFDVDWENKHEKIKQYLMDLLLFRPIVLYARKCSIKQIDFKEANEMYDKYHLLGKTTIQSISYGLFYNGELVSCMSFQKGRYKENKEPIWCLTRFVTKSGLTLVGGASKLLKHFEKEFNPSLLISFSDNDYFSGGVYGKLGFINKGYTSTPRYFWVLGNKEIKREQCQLKKLAKIYPELYKESLTVQGNKEDYIMLKLGAYKVYRSGHTKWVKKYSKEK